MLRFSLLPIIFCLSILVGSAGAAETPAVDAQIVFLAGHGALLAELEESGLGRSERTEILRREGENALGPLRGIRGLRVRKTWWSVRAALVEGDLSLLERGGVKLSHVSADRMERPEFPVSSTDAAPVSGGSLAWGLKAIHVDRVWERFGVRGRGVRIGIIDSGIDGTHPEFSRPELIVAARDFTSGNDPLRDDLGHGSHVAGTIAGLSLSGQAIGIAPDCRLLIAKAIGRSGARASALLDAMEWMIDPDGNPATDDAPRAVNCSWHSGYSDQEPYYAMIDSWRAVGIVPCFSAGNSGPGAATITRPKEHPDTFASAAIDDALVIAGFSSRGPASFRGQETRRPDWAAPGVDVYSVKSGGGYTKKSGTSMASPHVCGITALMLEARPDLDPAAIKEILQASALDRGEPGYDNSYGHGIIDAEKAVEAALANSVVQGQVRGAGKPLAASILVDGSLRRTDGTGRYRLALPAGSHRLRFSAFGWENRDETVVLREGGETELDVSLRAAEKIRIAGTIRRQEDGQPLAAARLGMVGHEEINAVSATDGSYALELPAGMYELRVRCPGYETWSSGERNFPSSLTLDAELLSLPPVLLVAGDGTRRNYETWYEKTLRLAAIPFRLHEPETDGALTEDNLLPYLTVIWLTGDRSSKVFGARELSLLERYLQSGGQLFISGQEAAYGLRAEEDFLARVLGVRFVRDKATKPALAEGIFGPAFALNGGDSAGNQRYPDVLAAIGDGTPFGLYESPGEGAGVLSHFGLGRSVILGFGLEGLPDGAIRLRVLRTVLDALKHDPSTLLERLAALDNLVPPVSVSCRRNVLEHLAHFLRQAPRGQLPELDDPRLLAEPELRGIILERRK